MTDRTPSEYANDAYHALAIERATNADLLQQLEEANAVIDKVRKVRDKVNEHEAAASALWCTFQQPADGCSLEAYRAVQAELNGIDGL